MNLITCSCLFSRIIGKAFFSFKCPPVAKQYTRHPETNQNPFFTACQKYAHKKHISVHQQCARLLRKCVSVHVCMSEYLRAFACTKHVQMFVCVCEGERQCVCVCKYAFLSVILETGLKVVPTGAFIFQTLSLTWCLRCCWVIFSG